MGAPPPGGYTTSTRLTILSNDTAQANAFRANVKRTLREENAKGVVAISPYQNDEFAVSNMLNSSSFETHFLDLRAKLEQAVKDSHLKIILRLIETGPSALFAPMFRRKGRTGRTARKGRRGQTARKKR